MKKNLFPPQRVLTVLLKGSLFCILCFGACARKPVEGPDKQFGSGLGGAITGAGTGAVTGFQVGAGAGPGAAVGAGLGAVAGGIQGLLQDQSEEQQIRLIRGTEQERRIAYTQQVLAEQFKRRTALHPTREIYPADLFFHGDEYKLKPGAEAIILELARLNKQRLPWSTLVVTAYVRANDSDSPFARVLAERRAKTVSDYLVKGGLEARRLQVRAVIVPAPVLIDPHDRPERYNQALELIPLDR